MKEWSTEERKTINKIHSRFYNLGLNAEFADDWQTRRKIKEAEKEFNEALEKGILLNKFLCILKR